MRTCFFPILLFFLLCKAAVCASAEVDEVIKPCSECHGSNGIATTPKIPHLNGQNPFYLQAAMSGLQENKRPSTIKEHVPKGFSEKMIVAVADYYAKAAATRPKQDVDAQLVARGLTVYNSKCADCHPDNGRESDKDSPLMAGQNVDYLMAQARLFKQGRREFAPMMDEGFRGVSEADLDSVAHFFASQDEVVPGAKKRRKR